MINLIEKKLFELQDTEYKNFQSALMPTVDKKRVIGVRTPLLRSLAKELKGKDLSEFFISLPHNYYEEDNLHAFMICEVKDFDECVHEVERFLPYINNWATCDSLRPRCFKKNTERLFPYIEKWLKSDHIYTVRFGIGMLMSYFLDESFDEEHIEKVAKIKSDEYYINMMSAWYFATALAKQWESVVPYIIEKKLDPWVHNKTIQKAVESFRITKEQKEFLKTLKIKKG